jgi:heat shock protein HslJ
MNRLAYLFLILLGLSLASCTDSMPPAPVDSSDSVAITGTIWRLWSIERDGATERIDSATRITLQFEAATFVGSGPCNRHNGAYTLDGAAMSIAQLTGGDGPCSKADLQASYLDDLRHVSGYVATDSTLTLYSAGGSVVLSYAKWTGSLEPEPRNVEIRGRVWKLVKIVGGGVVDTLVEAPWVTLKLAARASGAGPCNPYEANYTADSFNIHFTDLQHGSPNCPRAGRENRYIAALETAHGYRSTEKLLQIAFTGGTLFYERLEPADTVPNGPIAGREWKLQVIVEGSDSIPANTREGTMLTFTTSGSFAGRGPCSPYSGTYATDGRNLAIFTLDPQSMGCPDGDLENRYFRLLRQAQRYEATDSTLRIITANGAVLRYMRPRPFVNRLAGTSWKLEAIAPKGGGELPPNSLVTITFTATTLEGESMCNHYSAPYSVAPPSRMSISKVEEGAVRCPDRPYELNYFEQLEAVIEFGLTDDRLALFTPTATIYYRPM